MQMWRDGVKHGAPWFAIEIPDGRALTLTRACVWRSVLPGRDATSAVDSFSIAREAGTPGSHKGEPKSKQKRIERLAPIHH